MAIWGLGTDIVEVARIEQSLARGNSLVKRVLTPKEQEEMTASVDESAFLAFGRGISAGLSFQHMQVVHNEYGKPEWHFTETAAQWVKEQGISGSHLSISDEKHYAVATVILETD